MANIVTDRNYGVRRVLTAIVVAGGLVLFGLGLLALGRARSRRLS